MRYRVMTVGFAMGLTITSSANTNAAFGGLPGPTPKTPGVALVPFTGGLTGTVLARVDSSFEDNAGVVQVAISGEATSLASAFAPGVVPEPSSLAICGIGLLLAAAVRRRKVAAVRRCKVVRPHIVVVEEKAMARGLTASFAVLAIVFGGINESKAGPIDVSYKVSGTPGNYDLDFSVTNNMLAWPTQNVYFFAVRLSVDNVIGSPAPFFNNAPADANWFNYGGSATDYNNTWIASGPPFAPAFLLPGITHSGFIVHIPDPVAPTAVSWSALSVSAGEIHPYTGGGNFNLPANPGFEGVANPVAVPEPCTDVIAAILFSVIGTFSIRKRQSQSTARRFSICDGVTS